MAFDEGLAQRVREVLDDLELAVEYQMFGGRCLLFGGNMCCGIVGDELMLRVGPDAQGATLAREHAREMALTGRSMRGMVYVHTDGLQEDHQLAEWVGMAVGFAEQLPAK